MKYVNRYKWDRIENNEINVEENTNTISLVSEDKIAT